MLRSTAGAGKRASGNSTAEARPAASAPNAATAIQPPGDGEPTFGAIWFDAVLKTSIKYQVDMRTAAYIVAIQRVGTVTRMRGMYA